ncbi:MAG: hypothetical protein QF554_01600 [Dehalococcoidia bacterium]|jgi:uncharacterized protein YhaN|nr:hypothetical protein [Dehalococcoidia bacterium]
MRLDRVFLDSFGPLQSRDITGLSPGLNVVIGPDQEHLRAFRDFIRQVLFGFDIDAAPPFNSPSSPRGGLLEVVASDGSPLTIERYLRGRGEGAGQVSVSRAGESRPNSESMCGLPSIDQHSWLEKFDISSSVLDGDPDALLTLTLSLLWGVDGADIRAITTFFDTEEEEIRRAITAARTARQVAEERFRLAAGDFDSYATLHGQRADLERQITDADNELSVARARFHRIDALEESRPAWNRMHDLQSSMSDMPKFAFLPQGPSLLLETLGDRERELQAEIDSGDAEDSPRAAEVEELTASLPDDFPAEEVRRLLAHSDEYAEAVRELPVLSQQLEQVETDLKEGLTRLGHGWDEAKLDTVEDSPAVRDRLEKLEADIVTQRASSEELAMRSAKADETLESAQEQVAKANKNLEAIGPAPDITIESANERLDTITRAEGEMAELVTARETLAEALDNTIDARPRRAISAGRLIPLVQLGMSGGFAVVGIVLTFLAISAGDSALVRTGEVVGATGVIGVLMSIAILEVQRRHSRAQYEASSVLHELAAQTAQELEKDIETARTHLAYVEESLRTSLDELGLEYDLPMAHLAVERERLTRDIEQQRLFDEASAAAETAGDTADNASWAAEGETELAQEAANQLQAMEDDWIDILMSLGLQPELGLNAVRESLDLVAEMRETRSRVGELNLRVPSMRVVIVQVEAGLSELAEAADLPEFAAHEAAPVLDQLKEDREQATRTQDQIGKLRRDGETWATRRATAEREMETITRERKELLDLVGAEDEVSFRGIAAREEERRRLSTELDEIRRNSGHLTGPSGREIEAELQEAGSEALAAERDVLTTRATRLEELQGRLESRSLELDERLGELEGPPRTLEHRVEMSRLDEQLAELSRRLKKFSTARRLISDSTAEYGSNGQQDRLRLTGEYLKRLSGGTLTDIRLATASGDAMFDAFEVVSLNGHAEAVETLGGDLLRQLFLSAKLAIAHEQAENGEPVPVLLHDLGNMLGSEHERHFAAAAEELSQHTQVILLADHPGTADRARDAAISADPRVVDLGLQGRQIRLSA